MNSLIILSVMTMVVSAISLLAALGYVVVHLSRYRRPAIWALAGIVVWIVATFSSTTLMPIMAHHVGPADVAWYTAALSVIRSILHAAGLAMVVRAVFMDRGIAATHKNDASAAKDFGPVGDNPFSTPRTS